MDRRSFLRLLSVGLVAPVVVPPVRKFFAPAGGWRHDLVFHPLDPTSADDVLAAKLAAEQYYLAGAQAGALYQPDGGTYPVPGRLSTPVMVKAGPPLTAKAIQEFLRDWERRLEHDYAPRFRNTLWNI